MLLDIWKTIIETLGSDYYFQIIEICKDFYKIVHINNISYKNYNIIIISHSISFFNHYCRNIDYVLKILYTNIHNYNYIAFKTLIKLINNCEYYNTVSKQVLFRLKMVKRSLNLVLYYNNKGLSYYDASNNIYIINKMIINICQSCNKKK